jgi:putative ABC transport system substrate-binding protein
MLFSRHTRRRDFILALAGAAAWPCSGQAQSPTHVPEIGFLYAGSASALPSRIVAFADGLRSKGYVDGQNVTVVARTAEWQSEQYELLTRDLVKRNVRVLFAAGPVAVRHAQAGTRTIPIVALDLESDPVKSGFVTSIARPGGNLTGLFFDFPEFSTKWLQLLAEAVPSLSRLAVFWDPSTAPVQLDAVAVAAKSRGLSLHIEQVQTSGEFQQAFRSTRSQKADGALILSSPLFGSNPQLLAALSVTYRMPAITLFPEFGQSGGLLAYGTNLIDLYVQAGALVGKVLNGTRPEDLPIERPSRFLLVVNLKTAKVLGLDIPATLLARADEVIE